MFRVIAVSTHQDQQSIGDLNARLKEVEVGTVQLDQDQQSIVDLSARFKEVHLDCSDRMTSKKNKRYTFEL